MKSPLLWLLLAVAASAEPNPPEPPILIPAATNRTDLKAKRWPDVRTFKARNGTNAVVPLAVFYRELDRAACRKQAVENEIDRRTQPSRDYQQSVSQTLFDMGGPEARLKSLAASKAQQMGMPRHIMGDLNWYAPAPSPESYYPSEPAWQAACASVVKWQQLIIARLKLDAAAQTARRHPPQPDAKREAAVVKFLQEQVAQGSARAKFELGQRLLTGNGIAVDEMLGMAYIEQAAREEHPDAMDFLQAQPATAKAD